MGGVEAGRYKKGHFLIVLWQLCSKAQKTILSEDATFPDFAGIQPKQKLFSFPQRVAGPVSVCRSATRRDTVQTDRTAAHNTI